jgi:DNA-directed RNA polymerase specialized sigma24 family protein
MDRDQDLDPLVRHATQARALARELVCDEDEADDLVQNVWVATWR